MPKYTVVLTKQTKYVVVTDADTPSEAGDNALEMWAASETPFQDFDGEDGPTDVLRITRTTGG